MTHLQDYDDYNVFLIKNTNLPYEAIQKILLYSDCKNFLSIYKDCLKELLQKTKDTQYFYHLDYNKITTREYFKRYKTEDVEGLGFNNYDEIDLMFYFHLSNELVSTLTYHNYELEYDRVIQELKTVVENSKLIDLED